MKVYIKHHKLQGGKKSVYTTLYNKSEKGPYNSKKKIAGNAINITKRSKWQNH